MPVDSARLRLNAGVLILAAVALLTYAPQDLIGSSATSSQPATLVVTVIDSLSRHRIVNADVTDLSSNVRVSTDENGHARLAWPSSGPLLIRVRQLGFKPVTRQLHHAVAGSANDSATVMLSRVEYILPPVKTTAGTACDSPSDSTSAQLSAKTLEQIILGAEKYEAFRKKYPFRATIVRRTATLSPDGKLTRLVESKGEVSSENWGDRYRQGEVVRSDGLGFSVPLLFLGTLADPEFWRHHCFLARGIEEQSGRRLIRLDFQPARNVRTADWEGSAFIDSASSMLVRLEFSLANLSASSRPRRLEGYTTFKSPAPYFVIPDSTVAGWWRRGPSRGDWGMPDVGQSLYTSSVTYRNARPDADELH